MALRMAVNSTFRSTMARLPALLGIFPILMAVACSTPAAGRSSLLSSLTLHRVAAEPSPGVTSLLDTKGFAVDIEQPFLTVTTVTRLGLAKGPTHWQVEVILTPEDSERLETWTHARPSSQIAAVANNQVLSTMRADSANTPGTLLLSDYFTEAEARTITKLLVGE